MDGDHWWADDMPEEAIRQGDVLRRHTAGLPAAWGLVVTADCDIVQRKAGDRFTWLQIVTAREYLCTHWAPEQLRRLVARHAAPAAQELGATLRRGDPALDALTVESLVRWLAASDVAAIARAASPARPLDARLARTLSALKVATEPAPVDDALRQLGRAWGALGRDAAAQASAVREAFEGERGFPDFFLLPDMPFADGYGHVVLLREIASIDAADIFASEREARLADRPDAFHRIGRLHDGIRFAITQKLAFLFSRIGLPGGFERACSAATDLIVEGAIEKEIIA